jgi:hypothetical protein
MSIAMDAPQVWKSSESDLSTHLARFRVVYFSVAVAAIGLAGFIVVGAFLERSSLSDLGLGSFAFAALLLVLLADYFLAAGRVLGRHRDITVSPIGLSGQLLPPGVRKEKNGEAYVRSPLFQRILGRYPLAGVPWRDVKVNVFLGRPVGDAQTMVLHFAPLGGSVAGSLVLARDLQVVVRTKDMPYLTSRILEQGGRVEVMLLGRVTLNRAEMEGLGTFSRGSGWFRVRNDLAPTQVAHVLTAILAGERSHAQGA